MAETRSNRMRRYWGWLPKIVAALFILFASFGLQGRVESPPRASAQTAGSRVYLPLTASSFRTSQPLLLGNYPPKYLGTQGAIDTYLNSLDNWAGKGTSIAGLFLGLHDPYPSYNVRVPLELLWDNGYTAFVNLSPNRSAAQIAQGVEDGNIQNIAAAFAYWMYLAHQEDQRRFVFIAPLPEANITSGNTYGGDPASFRAAFRRIQDIFASEFAKANVPFDSVSWVFAPNGRDKPGGPAFETYYPGQDRVDVVAFSSYNWGYCVHWQYDRWQLGPELYLPVIQRMYSLAPGKPIFVGQTASTSEYPSPNNYDPAQKSQWFVDIYDYLAGLDDVRAVLYFNIDKKCDWAFFNGSGLRYEGYREAVSNPAYEYLNPMEVYADFSQP